MAIPMSKCSQTTRLTHSDIQLNGLQPCQALQPISRSKEIYAACHRRCRGTAIISVRKHVILTRSLASSSRPIELPAR